MRRSNMRSLLASFEVMFLACGLASISGDEIPSANYIRFRRASLSPDGDDGSTSLHRRRRLGLGSFASEAVVVVESGVVRKCGVAFDSRFAKNPAACPLMTDTPHRTAASADACASLCVENERCKSWNFSPNQQHQQHQHQQLAVRVVDNKTSSVVGESSTTGAGDRGKVPGGGGGGGGGGRCDLYWMVMRGTPAPPPPPPISGGPAPAVVSGLEASGDVTPPLRVVTDGTVTASGERVCSCSGAPKKQKKTQGRLLLYEDGGGGSSGADDEDDDEGREYEAPLIGNYSSSSSSNLARSGRPVVNSLTRTIRGGRSLLRLKRAGRASQAGVGGGGPPPLGATLPSGEVVTCIGLEDVCKYEKVPPPDFSTMCFPPDSNKKVGNEVIAIGQVWGGEVFHFFIENLVRLASLPDPIRRRVAAGGGGIGELGGLEEGNGGVTTKVHVVVKGKEGSSSVSPHQLELLSLLGVPASSVVSGQVRGHKVVVPASSSCGSPTHHQVLALRRLLLSSPIIQNAMLALLPSPAAARIAVAARAAAGAAAAAAAAGGAGGESGSTTDHPFAHRHHHEQQQQRQHHHHHHHHHDHHHDHSQQDLSELPTSSTSSSSRRRQRSRRRKLSENKQQQQLRDDEVLVEAIEEGLEEAAAASATSSVAMTATSTTTSTTHSAASLPSLLLVEQLWALPASIDVLVVQRTKERGLASHDALMTALAAASVEITLMGAVTHHPPKQSNNNNGTATTVTEKSNENEKEKNQRRKRKLVVKVFSDADATPKQADLLALFASAAVVIAPHGAGLSNIVVARPCALVLEVRSEQNPLCYQHLADRIGLRYTGGCSRGMGSGRNFGSGSEDPLKGGACPNMVMGPDAVKRVVKLAVEAVTREEEGEGGDARGEEGEKEQREGVRETEKVAMPANIQRRATCTAHAFEYMRSHALAFG